MSYDALFSPFRIRGLTLKNRIVLPGMETKMSRNRQDIGDNMIQYHVERAKAGCALNISECFAVCIEPQAPMYMGLYNEHQVAQLRKLTDAVHAVGGLMCAQLWHGGSAAEYFFDNKNVKEVPGTLKVERIHEIVKAFGKSAALALEAGFDAVEFHTAHGYLPYEFLNPTLNVRDDEYGNANLENRMRFCLECIEQIRANIPDDMPLFMRTLSIDEMMEKVMTEEEIVTFINRAAKLGVDIVNLTRGNVGTFANSYEVPPYNLPRGFNVENIYKIKKQINVPVMGVGRILTGEMANQLIVDGKMDLVGIGRAQIADPEWVAKTRKGREKEIRMCIGCIQGCYDAQIDPRAVSIGCTHNPMVCHEYEGYVQTENPKKVMVIGGGIGGMMAAETLQKRGHHPVIFEADKKLGGQFLLAGEAPGKQDFTQMAVWEGEEVERLGIEVHLNTTVTPAMIESFAPDAVIIATGADYEPPSIFGIDSETVYSQFQVLRGEAHPEGKIVVVGCGLVGYDVAELLAARGNQVTVIEKKGIGTGIGMLRRMYVKPEFQHYQIRQIPGSRVVEFEQGKVRYQFTDRKTGDVEEGEVACDAAVVCTGIVSRHYEDLKAKCDALHIPVTVIGDAKQARDGLTATKEGYEAGKAIL